MSKWHCSVSAVTAPTGRGRSKKTPSWLLERIAIEAELRYWPRPFSNVGQLFDAVGYLPPRKGEWRLTDYVLGHLTGLPKSYGRLVATNGVLCLLITQEGYYEGHLASFVHTNNLEEPETKSSRKSRAHANFSLAKYV